MMMRIVNYGSNLLLEVGVVFNGKKNPCEHWRRARVSDVVDISRLDPSAANQIQKEVFPGLTGRYRWNLCNDGLVLQVEEYKPWMPTVSRSTNCRSPFHTPPSKPRPGYEEFQWRNATVADLTVGSLMKLQSSITQA